MTVIQTRRELITGLVALIAAPAIVRAGSLMPVKAITDQVLVTVGGGGLEWIATYMLTFDSKDKYMLTFDSKDKTTSRVIFIKRLDYSQSRKISV